MKVIAEKMGWERDTSFFAGNQWLVKSSRGVHNIMSRDDALTPVGAVAVLEKMRSDGAGPIIFSDKEKGYILSLSHSQIQTKQYYDVEPPGDDFPTAVRDAALELWEGE